MAQEDHNQIWPVTNVPRYEYRVTNIAVTNISVQKVVNPFRGFVMHGNVSIQFWSKTKMVWKCADLEALEVLTPNYRSQYAYTIVLDQKHSKTFKSEGGVAVV